MLTEGPPAKSKPTDYNLCIKCQEDKKKEKLTKPRVVSTYETFLLCVNKRFETGNPDYVGVSQRLKGLSAKDLLEIGAQWHRNCYCETTDKNKLERDKAKYQINGESNIKGKGRPSSASGSVCGRLTRSANEIFNREACFFCQGSDPEKDGDIIHSCQSKNSANSIKDIVDKSDNAKWKMQLADILAEGDFLARDIVYHGNCKTTHWRNYVQASDRQSSREDIDESALYIAAEIEFFDQLREIVESGEYITTAEVETLYKDMMHDHGIDKPITRRSLISNISQNMPSIVISQHRGSLPGVLHSKKAGREAVDIAKAEQDIKGDLNSILKCAKVIRRVVINARKESPWAFTGHLHGSSESGVPVELMMMIRWILQGSQMATTESRNQVLHKSCAIISQTIMQELKTKRQVTHVAKSESELSVFRRQRESPFAVGLSLWMYHNLRSQKAINLLSNCGAGISYSRVTHVCSQIANAVRENININGVFLPPGIVTGRAIRASADNVDKKVDTQDGKNSFHAMAATVFQPTCDGESVVEQLDLWKVSPDTLSNVPSTCIKLSECDIAGSPKPRTSPCYRSYKVGLHADQFESALVNDTAWMISRYFNRPSQSTDSQDVNQRVPVWSAYNCLVNTPESGQQSPIIVDKAYAMPIINAPAHEWPTLVTTLNQLSMVNQLVSKENGKLIVTFDMDLYKRVLKLEYLDSQYKDKWVVCPGAFHTSLCALRCLGKTIEGSGIDEAWVEAEMYSSVTVDQIINGKHYSRAMEAHEVTLQVLFNLWIEAFFSERPAVRTSLEASIELVSKACVSKQGVREAHFSLMATLESINLDKQLAEFDARHAAHSMFQWARIYMRQVMTLLQFQRATRQGDWFLHLSSLEKLCVFFFAYNRLDYAQNIPEYVARMYQLQTTDPEVWLQFVSKDFTVNTSNKIPFTRLGVDHAQEHVNKNLKGQGAISGITQDPTTLLKFCMCAPELSRIVEETEAMVGMPNQNSTEHHRLNHTTAVRQEQAITNLSRVLSPCNIFTSEETHLFNLMTKEIIPKPIEESILSMEARGSSAMMKFVEERICGETNLWDKMRKCKILSWNSSTKEIKLQAKSDVLTLRATTGLMSRLLLIARSSREVDMEEVIGNYEFSTTNRTLMKPDGSVHPTMNKSSIITVLEELPAQAPNNSQTESSSQENNQNTTSMCLVVDGMAVVQEIMAVKTLDSCKELGDAYVTLIDAKGHNYHTTRVVFDNYVIEGSLKKATRDRRRGSKAPVRGYKVEDTTKIKNVKSFLGSTTTKGNLTLYLAKKLIDHAKVHIITATHDGVMSNRAGDITPGVSSQEEADTLMILHAVEAARAGSNVHIYSQDTDVLLLALRHVPLLGEKAALLMGTSDRRRLVLLKPIYDSLGEEKARALCKWHALTGCDTTGYIRGKSKKACLEAFLKEKPSIVSAISALGTEGEPSEDTIEGCISFLCSLFRKKGIEATDPHSLRWTLFKQQGIDKGIELLPPTSGAWREHILRAHCQCVVWEQDLIICPTIVNPLMFGWIKEDDHLVPQLSKIPPAPTAVVELVRCTCGASNPSAVSKCTSARCSCKRNNLVCTELCRCEADVDMCQNMNSHILLDPAGDQYN